MQGAIFGSAFAMRMRKNGILIQIRVCGGTGSNNKNQGFTKLHNDRYMVQLKNKRGCGVEGLS